jgi:hypothetical protein
MRTVDGVLTFDGLPATSPDRLWCRWLKLIARALLTLVAAFWTCFAIANVAHEGGGSIPYTAGFLLPVLILAIAAWRWPRIGGAALACGGVFAAFYFHHPFTQLSLALPAIVLGALLLLLR